MDNNNKKEEYRFPIKDLDFSVRVSNFLSTSVAVDFLEELAEKTVDEIRATKGFTSYHLKEIRDMLRTKGMSLKEDPDPENKERFQIPMK